MSAYDILSVATNTPTTGQVPGSGPTAVGYGGMVMGGAGLVYVIAKWQHITKDARKMFVFGLVVAVLLGSTTGIFGSLTESLRKTGNSVGDSVTDTTTGTP